MTELEFLRLQVQGIPVHKHHSPKRGEWFCRSPYCLELSGEEPHPAPGEPIELARARYDLGALDA